MSIKHLAAATIAGLLSISAARADLITYNLTLTPSAGSSVGGTGTLTINTAPATGLNAVSNYFQVPQGASGALTGLSFTLNGDTFTLDGQNPGGNALAQFTSGVLDDITYAGLAADGDSLMITSQYAYFDVKTRQTERGTFTATPAGAMPVPEAAAVALLGAGLLGLALLRRRARS
ncbi:MAG TPA: PEP-CTERM sorting domain-containing protein [Aliidongia sp.]|nr:PEP-CTERM sorting domain-containing protein [Aliidongia sp.]